MICHSDILLIINGDQENVTCFNEQREFVLCWRDVRTCSQVTEHVSRLANQEKQLEL